MKPAVCSNLELPAAEDNEEIKGKRGRRRTKESPKPSFDSRYLDTALAGQRCHLVATRSDTAPAPKNPARECHPPRPLPQPPTPGSPLWTQKNPAPLPVPSVFMAFCNPSKQIHQNVLNTRLPLQEKKKSQTKKYFQWN